MEVYKRRHPYNIGSVICSLQNMGIHPQDEVYIDPENARGGTVYFKEPYLYSLSIDLKENKFTENSLINVWEF